MRTVYDPFEGKDVQISDQLVDRLRGKYACGPHLPNGNPEFGWKQFQAPPIQHAAADRIEALEAALRELTDACFDEFGDGETEPRETDDSSVFVGVPDGYGITFGMLRRARAALSN